jgi:hypothetical protein
MKKISLTKGYVCDRIIADIVSGGHDGKRVVLYKRQACPVD